MGKLWVRVERECVENVEIYGEGPRRRVGKDLRVKDREGVRRGRPATITGGGGPAPVSNFVNRDKRTLCEW